MAQRARDKNSRNHERQLKENRAKAKYNWGMMVVNANADKIRNSYKDILNEDEGEKTNGNEHN